MDEEKNRKLKSARHKLLLYKQQQLLKTQQDASGSQEIVNSTTTNGESGAHHQEHHMDTNPFTQQQPHIHTPHSNPLTMTTSTGIDTNSSTSHYFNPIIECPESVPPADFHVSTGFETVSLAEQATEPQTHLENEPINQNPENSYAVTPLVPVTQNSGYPSTEYQTFEYGKSEQHSFLPPTFLQEQHKSSSPEYIYPDEPSPSPSNNGAYENKIPPGREEHEREREPSPFLLRSTQNHANLYQHDNNEHQHPFYTSDYHQQSGAEGQDAFELEFSQLRQDNAHLSKRETELVQQLQEAEGTLQELRRERDALAQEVRAELGPLRDKVNGLFEENQVFKQRLVEMERRVEAAEMERDRKQSMYEEMESAFILVSNNKMELAEKLDVEKERVKVLELSLQERNATIGTLTQRNADMDKELDVYAMERFNLERKLEAADISEAHAKIILLEKEVNELREKLKNQPCSSSEHPHHHHHEEDDSEHDHHKHQKQDEHAKNPGHDHHNHSHPDHVHGHNDGHNHDDHKHKHHELGHEQEQTHEHPSDLNSNKSSDDHDHDQCQKDGHSHSSQHDGSRRSSICSHSHSQDNHGHSHGHSHSPGDEYHGAGSEVGKGGHELSAVEKRQARLEWENNTYKEELEKLASLLKAKTADANALAVYKEEHERMRSELNKMEHLVIQLQGENDTIGDYITLYQSQKLALKEKALQKEAEMATLATEREQLRIRMNELNQILRSYNKSSSTGEEQQHSHSHSHGPPSGSSEPGITNFHPCGVCSGRLLNV